jgi:hypothetical protein
VFETDVAPVGGTAACRSQTVNFTSSDVAATIQFLRTKAGDQILLLDDVKLVGEIPSE